MPIQRLTRTEFGAAVNDLLGIELDAESPAAGRDRSPRLRQHRRGAQHLAGVPRSIRRRRARRREDWRWVNATPKLTSAYYPQPLTADQPVHVDGLPLGTRGGMKFRHTFPADGEYRFSIGDLGIDLYTRAVETRHTRASSSSTVAKCFASRWAVPRT